MPTLQINIGCDGPVLRSYMADRARRTFVRGPYGSGKTFGSAQKVLKLMTEQPPNARGVRPSRWLAIRNTFPDLLSTTAKDVQSVFGSIGKWHGGGMEPPCLRVQMALDDGTEIESEFWFQALDREAHAKKLKGKQMTGIYLSEVTELVKPIVDAADARTGRYPTMLDGGVACGWHGMIGDTNSCSTTHWYYKLSEQQRPEGWRFYSQPGGLRRVLGADGEPIHGQWEPHPDAENTRNLLDNYYMDLAQGKDDDWIAVFCANEWGFTRAGQPVHPAFIDSTHTARQALPYDRDLDLWIGIDFGRTPAAAFCQIHPGTDQIRCIDEYYNDAASASVFGPSLKRYIDKHYQGARVHAFGDPAGDSAGQSVETTPIQILQAAGIPVEPAPSNQPLLRRSALDRPLTRLNWGQPGFLLSPKCERLREGLMGGWCFRQLKTAEEEYAPIPDKGMFSHICEALEYCLMGLGEGEAALDYPDDGSDRQLEAYM